MSCTKVMSMNLYIDEFRKRQSSDRHQFTIDESEIRDRPQRLGGVRAKMRAIFRIREVRVRCARHAVLLLVRCASYLGAHRWRNKKQTVASRAGRRGLPLVGTIVRAVACSLDHEVKGLTRS